MTDSLEGAYIKRNSQEREATRRTSPSFQNTNEFQLILHSNAERFFDDTKNVVVTSGDQDLDDTHTILFNSHRVDLIKNLRKHVLPRPLNTRTLLYVADTAACSRVFRFLKICNFQA